MVVFKIIDPSSDFRPWEDPDNSPNLEFVAEKGWRNPADLPETISQYYSKLKSRSFFLTRPEHSPQASELAPAYNMNGIDLILRREYSYVERSITD